LWCAWARSACVGHSNIAITSRDGSSATCRYQARFAAGSIRIYLFLKGRTRAGWRIELSTSFPWAHWEIYLERGWCGGDLRGSSNTGTGSREKRCVREGRAAPGSDEGRAEALRTVAYGDTYCLIVVAPRKRFRARPNLVYILRWKRTAPRSILRLERVR
jgi:hypothetical protein